MDNPTKKINAMPKQKCDAETTKKTPKQNAEHTKNSIITGKNDVH